jgi:hypothetical protein
MTCKTSSSSLINRLLKFALILSVWAGAIIPGYSQRFYSVVFNQLPQDFQLYPRDVKNEAVVPISGIIEVPGYTYMSVQVMRNNSLIRYLKAPIKYGTDGIGSFATETTIKAELAQYHFKVYASRGADSVLMVTRENVVSGDAYVIMGQSNSTGFFIESETNEFCRSFGKITGTLNTEPYDAADTLWSLSNAQGGANVGTMGFELQKQLAEKSGIPNCLINAGIHWSTAFIHATRTEPDPIDFNNAYGRMLYRVQKAGLRKAVKSFIYRQGESEAYHEGSDWEENFKKFRSNLKLDLSELKKIYVFQIDIIFYPSNVGAQLRDYQRRLPDIYPDVSAIATVGTKGFDGLHYERDGNIQGGFELSRLILRDFYAMGDTANINSPAIKKVFYKSVEKKELVMVFDEGQELIYPGPHNPVANVTLHLKDFIYLNDVAGAVASGTADGNRVELMLSSPQTASKLSYLPPFHPDGSPYPAFTGPNITNKLGMRAFTFFQLPITDALETPKLTANYVPSGEVTLQWNTIKDATSYVLERKTNGQTRFSVISELASAATSFSDKAPGLGEIQYRIRAVSSTSESGAYGQATVMASVISGIEQRSEMCQLYPNPVKTGDQIVVRFARKVSGTVTVNDKAGKKYASKQIMHKSDVDVSAKNWPSGIYILTFQSGDQRMSKTFLFSN